MDRRAARLPLLHFSWHFCDGKTILAQQDHRFRFGVVDWIITRQKLDGFPVIGTEARGIVGDGLTDQQRVDRHENS